VNSVASARASSRCFLHGTLLKTLTGTLIPVENVLENSCVLSSTGLTLKVRHAFIHDPAEVDLVLLMVLGGSLIVTSTHRVMTDGGAREAHTLLQGDRVLCDDHDFKELLGVERSRSLAQVVDLHFQPDLPLEAFNPPPRTILTKGEAATSPPPTSPSRIIRRGRMNRRNKSKAGVPRESSLPGTFDDDFV